MLTISVLVAVVIVTVILLLTCLNSTLGRLAQALPRCHGSVVAPLRTVRPLLRHMKVSISISRLTRCVSPGTTVALLAGLLARLSGTVSSVFLLLLAILFVLLRIPRLPKGFRRVVTHPIRKVTTVRHTVSDISRCLILGATVDVVANLIT